MSLAVSNRVIARNGFGQFIAACERAATKTVEEAIDKGANLSRGFAPVGHKADSRTTPLKGNIRTKMLSSTSGEWYAFGRQALPQETGAVPHTISGSPGLKFFWEKAGRMFVPSEVFYHAPGMVTTVNHPGNPPTRYLARAYHIVMGEVMSIAAKNYPG